MSTPTETNSARKRSARKTTKPAKRKRTVAPENTKGRLKIRMYRVGFGDFFLVTVPTPSGDQYILIDCGVFRGTSGSGNIGSIVEAVEDMYQTTKGHLALVIMTHRHADHISGFSKARRFKDFTASMVWMPYWEQFNVDRGKAKTNNLADIDEDENFAFHLQLDIHDLAASLATQFRGREDPDAQEALAQLANATGIEDFNAVANGRKKGIGNAAALDVLKNHLGDNGKKVRYYAAGDEPELPDELQGLKARILGPPPRSAKAFLALTDLKKGVGQYLDSVTESEDSLGPVDPFPPQWTADMQGDYPQYDSRGMKIDYGRVSKDVDNSQSDVLSLAAAKIETFLNNQSLVVLFEFGGKKLLFAGDAQAGSWEYWLFKTKNPMRDPTKAGDIIATSKELLQTIDFYKVGHHGSTNATPIQAVEAAIARPKSSNGFVSMCSTEDGVYGNHEKGTEVPRIALMEALGQSCCLIRSDSFPITISNPEKKVIPPAKGMNAKLPKPKVGEVKIANLYIEYSF
jgi:hypothetical protein